MFININLSQNSHHGVSFLESFNICDNNPYIEVFRDEFNLPYLDTVFWATNYPYQNHTDSLTYNKYPNNYVFTGSTIQLLQKADGTIGKLIPWLSDNQIMDDGRTNKRWFPFTGAVLFSKYQFKNGIFEANIKIPNMIKGNFPAFWLYSDSAGTWNELDIFEFLGDCQLPLCEINKCELHPNANWDIDKSNKTVSFTIHRQNPSLWDKTAAGDKKKYNNDLHLSFKKYGVIWEKNKIQGYIDNDLPIEFYHNWLLNILGQEASCNIEPFNIYLMNKAYPVRPMNIILNTAVHNPNPSNCSYNKYQSYKYPDTNSIAPNIYEIDYISVKKRVPICSGNFSFSNKSSLGVETSNIDFPGDDNNWEGEYNLKTGTTLTLSNISLDSTEQLDLRATNFIKLTPGFHSKKSFFRAKGENWRCSKTSEVDNLNLEEITIYLDSNIVSETFDDRDDLYSFINNDDILIYPNPTINYVNIILPTNNSGNLRILDISGNVVEFKEISNSNPKIEVTSLKPGIYTIEIKHNSFYYFKKLIKTN